MRQKHDDCEAKIRNSEAYFQYFHFFTKLKLVHWQGVNHLVHSLTSNFPIYISLSHSAIR